MDFILVDYMDRNINLTRLEKKSSSKRPIEFDGYTKVAELPYAVKISVEELETSKIIKELSVPIKGGYYKEKIVKVQDLSYEVLQYEKYTLPKTAKAVLNNGKSAKVNLDFGGAVLDTSEAKEIKLPVKVHSAKYDYSSETEAVFKILPRKTIKSIPELSKRLRKGEDFTLPESVEVVCEDETRENRSVQWTGTFNKDIVRVYKILGTVRGTKLKAKIVISVEKFNPDAKYTFVDPAVGEAVADKLAKDMADITYSDLQNIKNFNLAFSFAALNLEDFKEMTNLTSLDLSYNEITDIQPLSGLKKLKTLNLFSNKVASLLYENLFGKAFRLFGISSSTFQDEVFPGINSGSIYGSFKYSTIISPTDTSFPYSSRKSSPDGSKIFKFISFSFSMYSFTSFSVTESMSSLVSASCKSGSETYDKFSFLYINKRLTKSDNPILKSS